MTGPSLQKRLEYLQTAAVEERDAVLGWWLRYLPDGSGGLYGEVDWLNTINKDAPKGLVLYSRILWAFSAAFEVDARPEYREMADCAYRNLLLYFEDTEFGGMYWLVTSDGKPLQDKKQLYGLAFSIYGLSEYCRVTGMNEPGDKALLLFELMEKYGRDPVHGGYFEAFTRDWKPLDDLRLSDKEANEKKTMNTHLHVLEAYTNLYRIRHTPVVAEAIRALLQVFRAHIIDTASYSQGLFFSEDWQLRSSVVSFGHDIEASWLLYEAAEVLNEKLWMEFYHINATEMADAAMKGLDTDGGLFYELDTVTGHCCKEKHWWPQAEAVVGFLNAYQLDDREQYLSCAEGCWKYIIENIKDRINGEWYWGIDELGKVMTKEKAGSWKCPYHNVRACLEISKRIRTIQNTFVTGI